MTPAKPRVSLSPTKTEASQRAAEAAASVIRRAIETRGRARILVGTGNSQLEMIGFLTRIPQIEWPKVEAFHLDEYVGIGDEHSASFRRWIRINFGEKVPVGAVHYMDGLATDLDAMVADYGRRLLEEPVDLAFVGIGENGHIAFNDPHVADFDDPKAVKCVTLDEACRRQQVGEGHFPDVASVPAQAITVTCTGLFRAGTWICCVTDQRKATAVNESLSGPVTTKCPGSLVQRHPDAALYLDHESAALLSPEVRQRFASTAAQ